MIRAVIYARESSDDTGKAPSIEEQIKRGRQYFEEMEDIELIEVYQDNGYSGGDWTRPEWNRLVREARGHKFTLVWVFAQDRIARDTEQFLWFYRNLKESHVSLISSTEGTIDLESVGGLAQNISLAMASHLFRKVTSDKVKNTYLNKKKLCEKKGIEFNWGRKAKNYDLDKILSLRASGKGYRLIAREFGCSYQTIRRLVLQNTRRENQYKNEENKGVLHNSPIK